MNLSPITSRQESKKAFATLKSHLKAGAKKFKRTVGVQGSSGEHVLYWHKDDAFWVAFRENIKGRFWYAYGTTDPTHSHSTLHITLEINPPTEGIDRRCGGVFLKDSASGLYLAHSGKVGGGCEGIGKTNFLKYYGGRLQEIEWPNGITADVVVLGKIGSRSFLANLATYIREVETFKTNIREVETFKANPQRMPVSIVKKIPTFLLLSLRGRGKITS